MFEWFDAGTLWQKIPFLKSKKTNLSLSYEQFMFIFSFDTVFFSFSANLDPVPDPYTFV